MAGVEGDAHVGDLPGLVVGQAAFRAELVGGGLPPGADPVADDPLALVDRLALHGPVQAVDHVGVGVQLSGDDPLAQPPDGADQQPIPVPRHRVDGEHHPGHLPVHHRLDHHAHPDPVQGDVLHAPVGQGAGRERGRPAATHRVLQGVAVLVEEGVVLAGEGVVAAVLADRAGAHRHGGAAQVGPVGRPQGLGQPRIQGAGLDGGAQPATELLFPALRQVEERRSERTIGVHGPQVVGEGPGRQRRERRHRVARAVQLPQAAGLAPVLARIATRVGAGQQQGHGRVPRLAAKVSPCWAIRSALITTNPSSMVSDALPLSLPARRASGARRKATNPQAPASPPAASAG